MNQTLFAITKSLGKLGGPSEFWHLAQFARMQGRMVGREEQDRGRVCPDGWMLDGGPEEVEPTQSYVTCRTTPSAIHWVSASGVSGTMHC